MLVGVTFIICSPPQVRATERVCSGLVDLLHRPLSRHAELIAHTEAVRIGEALRRSLAVSAGPVPAFLELFGLGVGVIVRVAVAVLVLTVAGLGDARVDGLIHIVAVTADVRDVALRGFAGGDPAFVEAIAVAIVVGVPGRHVDGVAVDHGVAVVVEAVADLGRAGVDGGVVVVAVVAVVGSTVGARLIAFAVGRESGLDQRFLAAGVEVVGGRARIRICPRINLDRLGAIAISVEILVPGVGVVLLAVAVVVHAVAALGRTRVDGGFVVIAVVTGFRCGRVPVTVRIRGVTDTVSVEIQRVLAVRIHTAGGQKKDQREREKVRLQVHGHSLPACATGPCSIFPLVGWCSI